MLCDGIKVIAKCKSSPFFTFFFFFSLSLSLFSLLLALTLSLSLSRALTLTLLTNISRRLNVNQTLWGRVGGMGNGNLYSTLDVEGTNFHHVVIAYSGSSTSDSTPWWKTTIGIGMLATIGGLLVLVLITLSIMAVVIFVKRSRKRSHGYSLLSPTN